MYGWSRHNETTAKAVIADLEFAVPARCIVGCIVLLRRLIVKLRRVAALRYLHNTVHNIQISGQILKRSYDFLLRSLA